MTRFLKICVSLLFLGVWLLKAPESYGAGKPTGEKEVMVLKAGKEFFGGDVEIFFSTGEFWTAQKISKRKVVIDFRNVPEGTYIIRLHKNRKMEEFKFSKR